MTTPTQAERMRDECVIMARFDFAHDKCARNMMKIPLPTPTPLEAARERFTEAWVRRERLLIDSRSLHTNTDGDGYRRATQALNLASDDLLRTIAAMEAPDA